MSDQEQPSGDSQVQEELDVGTTSGEHDEIQLDENGLPLEQADAEEDELEEDLDGVKVRGKKEALERLKAERLMQADYTRKTQEVAEQRKAIEAERERVEQTRAFEQQNLDIVADIRAMDRQLHQLQSVNLMQLSNEDPVKAQQLMLQMQNLQTQRGQAANALAQRHQQFTQWQQHEAARALDEGRKVLQREIPGWNADLASKLLEFGKSRGYPEAMLANVTNPRFVVDLFQLYQTAEAKKKATQRTPVVQEKPVTRVSSASKAGASVDPDKLSPEQWVKWRNSQIRSRK